MDIASTQEKPPALQGSGKGKTVIILGAGLAGMTAAYELGKLGYACTLIEARGFAGGRCQTARAGKVLEELGGEKQVCRFDKGQYINFGPWRIPFNHRSTLHYTREFGIVMELFNNDNEAAYVYNEHADGPLAGRRLRQFEVKADMRGHVDELLAKSLKGGLMDQQVTAQDKALLIDYLANEGHLSRKDLAYRGTGGRGYKVNPGAGLSPGPGVPSDPLGFSDLLRSRLGHIYHSVHEFEQQATMLQPVGGMDQIARGFEKRVGRKIRYNTEVTALRNLPDKVEVMVKDAHTGKAGLFTGDFCLCTIPLSVLRHVEANFSDRFKTAIQGAAYAPVGKMGLQMKRRFWEEDDGIYGGHVLTDTKGINLISVPSSNWQGKKGTLLGYYNFAADAAEISALSLKERTEYALAAGEKVFPGQYRASLRVLVLGRLAPRQVQPGRLGRMERRGPRQGLPGTVGGRGPHAAGRRAHELPGRLAGRRHRVGLAADGPHPPALVRMRRHEKIGAPMKKWLLAIITLLGTAALAQPLDGKALFAKNCAACHQASGTGIQGAFPALKGNRLVLGDANPVITTVLKGVAACLLLPPPWMTKSWRWSSPMCARPGATRPAR